MSGSTVLPHRRPTRVRYAASRLGLILAVLLIMPAVAGAEAVLEAVNVSRLPGNRLELRFQLSEPAESPRSFSINEPARIVLDFADTRSGLPARTQPLGEGVAEDLNVLASQGRTRATVRLTRLVPYSVQTQGSTVVLTLDSEAAAPARPAAPVSAPALASAATSSASRSTAASTLGTVDFRRGMDGQAIIEIPLPDPGLSVDVREEGNRIVADFLGMRIPRGEEMRLDVTDFATPVASVDVLNRGGNARVEVATAGRYEYLAYQAENLYTIEVKPLEPEREDEGVTARREKVYEGDLLSLNFQDIEVRAVLQIIADFTGLNVVVSDTVQGNLTLRLQNVPWDQALDIILRSKDLDMRRSGNVIYVAPAQEIAERERRELESLQQAAELTPLRSELIQVNYAKASDLSTLLKSQENSLLSDRGTVSVDVRTNTLLVQDVPEKIGEVRDLVTRLDVPVRQVMIDSRIVIANDDFSKELGVRFGATGVAENDGNRGVVGLTGSAEGSDTIVNDAVSNISSTGSPFPVDLPSLNQRLGVNLPVSDATGRLALAILGQDYLLDLELSALQAEGRGEILSNPRVITTDRNEAVIKQGFEVPYVTPATAESPATVSFKEALLKLEVTPQITPDGRIIMDLTVAKDEPDFTRAVQGNPPLNKREVQTQVLVNNGETVVLGGVFEQVTSTESDKVPLLGDLPAVGRLFRRDANQNRKLELLIFVTPQVVAEGLAAR